MYTKSYLCLMFCFYGFGLLTAQPPQAPNNCVVPMDYGGFPSPHEAAYELFQPVIYSKGKLVGYQVRRQGKYGMIDLNNNPILPLAYDHIFKLFQHTPNQYFALQKGKDYQVYNPETGYFSTEIYDELPMAANIYSSWIKTSQSGKKGALLLSGEEGTYKTPKVLFCKYEAVDYLDFQNERKPKDATWAVKTDQKWSFLNHSMQAVGATSYDSAFVVDDVYEAYDDFIRVLDKGKYGLLAPNTQPLLPCEYERLAELFTEVFIAQKNGKWGIVGLDNQPILPFLYDTLIYEENSIDVYEDSKEGLLLARKAQKWALCKLADAARLKPEDFVYDQLHFQTDGRGHNFYYAQKNGKWGIIDANQKQIYPFLAEAKIIPLEWASYRRRLIGDTFGLFYQGDRIIYYTLPAHIQPSPNKIYQKGLMNAYDNHAYIWTFERGARVLQEKLIAVQEANAWGLLDAKTGEELLPIRYDSIRGVNPNCLVAYKNGRKKLYAWNPKNTLVEIANGENLEAYGLSIAEDFFVKTQKNGKYGLLNTRTAQNIPPIYERIELQSAAGGIYYLKNLFLGKKGDKWGLLDFSGKARISFGLGLDSMIVIPDWQDKLLAIAGKKGDKWGLLDTMGKPIYGFEYDAAPVFFVQEKKGKEHLCWWLFKNGQYEVWQEQKKLLSGVDSLWVDMYGDFLICRKNAQYLFLDKNYQQIGTNAYDWVGANFSNQNAKTLQSLHTEYLLIIQKNQKYGTFDTQIADFVIPTEYDFLKIAEKKALIAKKNGQFGLLDAKGQQILPFVYDTIQTATSTHVLVEQAGKLSLVEIPTEILTKNIYFLDRDKTNPHPETACIFQSMKGKKVFMNPVSGTLHLQVGYDSLLQKTGFSNIPNQNEKMYFAAFKNGKWGLVDIANTVILPFEYEQIGQVLSIHETISVKKDGKWGLVGMNGQPLTEFLASESALENDFHANTFFFPPKNKVPKIGWQLVNGTRTWVKMSEE